MSEAKLFDNWPEKYDRWFETPIGRLVFEYENEVVQSLMNPGPGDHILDAGCGTGLFTLDFLKAGAQVTGLELSYPMLAGACRKTEQMPFFPIQGDMRQLPFADRCFDKAVSVTALEFVNDADTAVSELFRVVRSGGTVMVATLNSLSAWAERRKAKTRRGEKHVLETARFRSPQEIAALAPYDCTIRTAVFFDKHEDPEQARVVEKKGQAARPDTGAFVVNVWQKP